MFIVILFYFDASAKTQIKLHKNPWIFKQYQGSFYYHIIGVSLNLYLGGQPTLLREAQKHQIFHTGNDKADLAASIQKLYGRVDAIEPAVTAQGNNIYTLNSVMSATTQAVGDFKTLANEQLASLNGAVFTSRCGCGNGCGNGSPRFVKRDNYCLNDSSLQAIETCG